MNLSIFKLPDPSGKLSKESYLIKNNNEEYCKDLKLCYKYSSLFTKELDK